MLSGVQKTAFDQVVNAATTNREFFKALILAADRREGAEGAVLEVLQENHFLYFGNISDHLEAIAAEVVLKLAPPANHDWVAAVLAGMPTLKGTLWPE